MIQSEKIFYGDKVREAYIMDGVDAVLWGEDLAHTKVVLYPKRLQDMNPGQLLLSR